MADHTITITNAVQAFGPAPASKWGTNTPYTMTWGTTKWGEGTEDLQVAVEKSLSESVTPSDALDLSVGYNRTKENSLAFSSEMTFESLTDGSGYLYVFVSNTTDAEGRDSNTWTAASRATTTYSTVTVTSTTWS